MNDDKSHAAWSLGLTLHYEGLIGTVQYTMSQKPDSYCLFK